MYNLRCFTDVYEATLDELKSLVDVHFGQYYKTALLDNINAIIEEQVERCRNSTIEKMQWLLELENPPFTNNAHYFSSYREKYLARYKEVRKVRLAVAPALNPRLHPFYSLLLRFCQRIFEYRMLSRRYRR